MPNPLAMELGKHFDCQPLWPPSTLHSDDLGSIALIADTARLCRTSCRVPEFRQWLGYRARGGDALRTYLASRLRGIHVKSRRQKSCPRLFDRARACGENNAEAKAASPQEYDLVPSHDEREHDIRKGWG